ncbi:uncharacterized protein TNIN_143261 [Trichonephila inaurata madagascariensis]|uniref:Uncharacterized protein n=1 Tax=Trichonephila inaurata madagascariensis TaxID=2747483 RepID=A0A8X6YY13_9ARAC|nr:uncharacterized protein TNIN_143261 [Trichonephila inaurata madagascariensis]
MLRHRKHHSSNLLKSTPDLSVEPKSDQKTSRTTWRTSSANIPHRPSASPTSDTSSRTHMTDTSSSSGDCSISSPHRRTRTVSPHHNRSLSFRNMKRPTPQQIQCEDQGYNPAITGFRPRGSTMPSDNASYYLARRRMRSKVMYNSRNLTPSPPIHEPGDDEDDEFYLCRSFSISSKGAIVNRGDFIRQRSRSNNSVASTASSLTTGGNNTSCASNATSYSSGGQGRGPSSKVQILGSTGVGKTALINQFMNSEYMNTFDTQVLQVKLTPLGPRE